MNNLVSAHMKSCWETEGTPSGQTMMQADAGDSNFTTPVTSFEIQHIMYLYLFISIFYYIESSHSPV